MRSGEGKSNEREEAQSWKSRGQVMHATDFKHGHSTVGLGTSNTGAMLSKDGKWTKPGVNTMQTLFPFVWKKKHCEGTKKNFQTLRDSTPFFIRLSYKMEAAILLFIR